VITKHLQDWRDGDPEALARLTTAMYAQLRRVALGLLRGEPGGRTVQPTVLVHELYLQLPSMQQNDWQSRAQFLNVAATVMRHILVDYARRKRALKRGGGTHEVFIQEGPSRNDPGMEIEVLLVHELLDRFSVNYPRQAKVVELRYFGGLTEEETSEILRTTGIESSNRTVARDWAFAKAWLRKSMSHDDRRV
jgi:RNA polymerase sigma-70 factor (ECF subfamily)